MVSKGSWKQVSMAQGYSWRVIHRLVNRKQLEPKLVKWLKFKKQFEREKKSPVTKLLYISNLSWEVLKGFI